LELLGLIEDYRQGLVPLIVPLTLLKNHLNHYPVPDWVDQQVYLHPYPKELIVEESCAAQAPVSIGPNSQQYTPTIAGKLRRSNGSKVYSTNSLSYYILR
jgi:hypothetical protein